MVELTDAGAYLEHILLEKGLRVGRRNARDRGGDRPDVFLEAFATNAINVAGDQDRLLPFPAGPWLPVLRADPVAPVGRSRRRCSVRHVTDRKCLRWGIDGGLSKVAVGKGRKGGEKMLTNTNHEKKKNCEAPHPHFGEHLMF